jgi:hypothetical protein
MLRSSWPNIGKFNAARTAVVLARAIASAHVQKMRYEMESVDGVFMGLDMEFPDEYAVPEDIWARLSGYALSAPEFPPGIGMADVLSAVEKVYPYAFDLAWWERSNALTLVCKESTSTKKEGLGDGACALPIGKEICPD